MILTLQHTSAPLAFTRIISLVPSITELLFDLDLEEEVMGITKFCIHPRIWFTTKTRVGGTKNTNIETIERLGPDLIIANKEENLKEDIEKLSGSYPVLLTDVKNLEDALKMISDIGQMTNRSAQASVIVSGIRAKFKNLQHQIEGREKINSAYFIWREPYMVAGGNTFINDMMHRCGLQNIFSSMERYPEITLDQIKESSCQLLLLSSEPYPFKEKHIREIQLELPALKIILADGEMFSWYGSHLLKAAAYFEAFYSKIPGL